MQGEIKYFIQYIFLPAYTKYFYKLVKALISWNKLVLDQYFHLSLSYFLLILCGDIELNPGPQSLGHSLSILHLNIRSIRTKLEYIKNQFLDFDILCFTETHLDDTVLSSDIHLAQSFDILRKDRNCHGGGILVYLNKNLAYERIAELEVLWNECIWFKIKQKSQILLFGIFYSPKTCDKLFFELLNQNLEKAYESTKNVVILGDLNEDLLNVSNHNLKNVLLVNSMKNIVTEPTRGIALLDPIITPFDQIILDSGVMDMPPNISDHSATYVTIPFDYILHNTFKRKIWLYKRANYTELDNKINNFDWDCLNSLSLNEAVDFFTTSFLNFVKECIPSKEITVRSDDKPWFDSELRKWCRKRDRLKAIATISKKPTDWRKYKDTRNKVNNMKKYAKDRFYNNLELTLTDNYDSNRRNFWKLTRYFIKSNSSSVLIPPLCTVSDDNIPILHSTDKEKADCLNDYFTSISTVCDDNVVLPVFQKITDNSLSNFDISENEVKDIINSLNINKASGPDLINHKMLKYVSNSVSKPLTIIFNRSLREKIFPDTWKRNMVVPIFKKGERSDPSNYRPVSLCSPLGKIMERIVFKNLFNYLYTNDLLYKYQSGFIPGHSTTFQLVDIYHHICQTLDNKQYACMVFCDISKAFDRVWHKGLLYKLKQNGIEGEFLEWISNYLEDRKQYVVLNSSNSEIKGVSAGVPQGSVLGPLLFLVYVNDITDQLLCLTRLFADDSSLFISATDIRDIEGIVNHDLIIISQWAKQWLVKFNPNKTEAILFSLRKPDILPDLIFDDVKIDLVDQHKHLGLTFNSNGKWNEHVENILSSASKIIGIMRKLKYSFSRKALNQIYVSYVRPIFEYSSIVWDNCTAEQANSLEKMQNEAARIVTGLTRSVSLENLYNECGWDSLSLRRKSQKLKFMYKVTHNSVPSYILDIIPLTVGEISRYELRNRQNISTFSPRTTIFAQSCIPSCINAWNNLDVLFRNTDSYSSFCYNLKKEFSSSVRIPNYYLVGKRTLSVLHCRLRNNCSDLHYDLYLNHLRDNSLCECLEDIEDAEHFIFKCPRYYHSRIAFFNRTRVLHPLSVHAVLYGNPNLTDHDNEFLFNAVQIYIQDTRRFKT